MKKKLVGLAGSVLGFMPLLVFAQYQSSGGGCSGISKSSGTIQGIICEIGRILDLIIPIVVVLGVLYFVWGVVSFILAADDEAAKKKGRDRMVFGVIGLVVIVALWGLVAIVNRTFGLGAGAGIRPGDIPSVPF